MRLYNEPWLSIALFNLFILFSLWYTSYDNAQPALENVGLLLILATPLFSHRNKQQAHQQCMFVIDFCDDGMTALGEDKRGCWSGGALTDILEDGESVFGIFASLVGVGEHQQ